MDGPGERDDPQGPALQPAIGLFFAGGKEAVEIDVQLLRGGGFPHPRTIANIQAAREMPHGEGAWTSLSEDRHAVVLAGNRPGTVAGVRDLSPPVGGTPGLSRVSPLAPRVGTTR